MPPDCRIAMLVASFPAETFVVRQVSALNAEVVTFEINHTACQQIELNANVFSLTGGRSIAGGLWRRGCKRVRRTILGEPAPSWPSWVEQRWLAYLRDRKPDVVLAQFGPNAMRCINGCLRYGVPLVAHFHGYDVTFLTQYEAYCRRLPDVFKHAHAIVGVSKLMCDMLIGYGCPPEKLHRIPCGVPVHDFPASTAQDNQPCRFLAVGRMIPVKAPLMTLRAFTRCAEACPEVSVTMIGNGPLFNEVQRWVQKNPYRDRIQLIGAQPIEVVREHLRSSGVFVQHCMATSVGQIEGWPVSIAEAMSSALPVIATRHAGIPEQVVHGCTGYLVAEGDWQAMGDYMIELAQAPATRRAMGLAGRAHIEIHGNFEIQVARLAEVIQSAAGMPKRTN